MTSTPSKRPVLPRNGLLGVVVFLLVHDELEIHEIPAGERAGGFANVFFGVVADAHGEQLHDFAREVLVGCALDVDARVQEGEHRGILRDGHHQVAEIAEPLLMEQLELAEQLAVVADLGFVDGEVAVPEQRHLFLKRAGRRQHAIGPPIGRAVGFENTRAKPVEEFIDDRLNWAAARRALL